MAERETKSHQNGCSKIKRRGRRVKGRLFFQEASLCRKMKKWSEIKEEVILRWQKPDHVIMLRRKGKRTEILKRKSQIDRWRKEVP